MVGYVAKCQNQILIFGFGIYKEDNFEEDYRLAHSGMTLF
jgi:hypothetical protein